MSRIKGYIDTDVLTEAKKRIHHIYDIFDTVVVMFSGGKDSLAVLHLCKEVMEERGLTKPEAMLLTIRINRAKGSHVAVQMSEIVRELIDVHKYDPQQIAQNIGATMEEIDLLYQDGVFKMKNIKDYKYSKAWYPKETRGAKVAV